MPITNVTPKSNSSSKDNAVNRSTFRPPWVREDGAETVKPSQWRRPSATTATPAADTAKTSEPDKKAAAEKVTPALKKTTVKTQGSVQSANENGQEKPKEVSAKLQSREIKVPIMTERKKPEPPAPTTTLKKDTKPAPEKPKAVEEDLAPKLLKSNLKPIEKISSIDKIPLQREMSTDKKFIRPVLRKTPKVEETFKEHEKVKAPTVVLKRTEPIKKDPVKKPEIESVHLQRAVLNKKEPERELPKKKLEPVKHSFSKKAMPVLEDDDEEEEEEEVEEEEETETESEESDEESTEEDTPKISTPAKPEVKPPAPEKSAKETAPKSENKIAPPPPPPPPPKDGLPPPPPPPPGPATDLEKKPITKKHKDYIEKLKTRPRRRPDWSEMMKEVESGRKLRHVQCNDRSNPILTSKSMTKVKGEFIYETEKATKHNQLLESIQIGVRLRPTKTNDRSKPILEGLRKFRRQMTVEEQVLKSESRAVLNTEADDLEAPPVDSPDEMDDIDKLRDDLQSTKQLLAIELRSREAQDRENKRLQQRVQNLEAELAREKWVVPIESQPDTQQKALSADESLVESLKQEAKEAQNTAKLLEKKFHDTAELLDKSKNEIEEHKRQIALLEKKLAQAAQGVGFDAGRRPSEAHQKDSSPEPEPEVSESEEDESEEKKAERHARRLARDVRVLSNQLSRFKDKKRAAKREREMLRSAMKKNHVILKQEKKKFKKIQREVDKISAMMKDEEDEDDENAEPKEEKEPEEVKEEESDQEESESSEEESDNESGNEASESEPEDAPDDKKKDNLEPRVKRHEGRLTALKKGNFLLQANVERLLDEINKTRENSVTLQNDLDSILCELG